MVLAMVIAAMPRSDVEITCKTAPNAVTRRVRERVHFWARPTMEKGSQWVGIKEWRRETVAIPPMVETSLAVKVSIPVGNRRIYRSRCGGAVDRGGDQRSEVGFIIGDEREALTAKLD